MTLDQIDSPLIVNGHNRQLIHSQVIGALSIKCMFNGRAIYGAEGAQIAVDDHCYLILNHAQPYNLLIEAEQPVESFCVFFPISWQSDVFRHLCLPDETLLDNPYEVAQRLLFFEIAHPHDDLVSPILFELRRSYQAQGFLSDLSHPLLYALLRRMLAVQLDLAQQADAFPGVRTATRQELYRRLHLAIEFLHSHPDERVSLDEMARAATMSPYHFLRRFTEAFGMTPQAYQTRLRLERAEALLLHSDLPISEVCLTVGYRSLGSFSALFSRHYGLSPRAFRQKHRY
ncbi:MAG: helix-turn-helix transcriptional regulator [Chloroflexi bacterium]|nr:helix-turn-helix transcriptional regulator [Chloroflexota bacterium]